VKFVIALIHVYESIINSFDASTMLSPSISSYISEFLYTKFINKEKRMEEETKQGKKT